MSARRYTHYGDHLRSFNQNGVRVRVRAQALVEFALASAVFMLLVLGSVDLARAYLAYTVVANVAREASRYGAAHVNDAGYQSGDALRAGMRLAIGIDASPSALSLNETTTPIPGLPYSYFKVSGTYRFQSLTPLVGTVMGNPIIIPVDTSALVD